MKNNSKYLAIILAAGHGSRLDKNIPKPLYIFNNRPIIDHLIDKLNKIPNIDILTVVGYKKNLVTKHIKNRSKYIEQKVINGTAGAVKDCLDIISLYNNTFVFVGDSPLVKIQDIENMIKSHTRQTADCTFLYSKFPIKLPYARLYFDRLGKVEKIVEHSDISESSKQSQYLFTSQYLFSSKSLVKQLPRITSNINTKEYNLTEIINLYIQDNKILNPIFVKDFWTLMGINTSEDIETINNYIHEK